MKNKKERTRLLANNIYILKTVWQADKSRVFVDILSQIFRAFSSYFLWIYFPKLIIDIIISHEEIENKIRTAITISAIFAIALLLEQLLDLWYNRLFRPVSDARIREKVAVRFFRKASNIELSCYENADFYDRYTRAANELNERAITVMDNITFFIYCFIEMFLVGITILLTDIWSFLIVALFLTSYIFITPRLNKARFDLDMAKTKPDRIKSYVMRVLYLGDYAKEIKMYNIQNVLMKNYKNAMHDIDSAIKKHGPKLAFWRGTFDNIVHILRFGTMNIYIAARALVWKTIKISDIALLITSINWFQWVLERFIVIYNNAHQHSLYIDNLRDFLEYQPKIISGEEKPENGNLELKNVSFTYDGSDTPVLKNINIKITKGQKIAIVGHNGAGKTTLIKLLLRLYDPDSGEINLNGENIRNLKLAEYRDLFGTVFQDFRVFSMSVAENVLMRESVPDDENKVISALKESGVYERIMSSEKGLSSNLTKEFDDDGLVLSGGETQKVAIARAFAKNNDILILDEPSSSLDPIAEYEMFENLIRLSEGKTVIFISHRLSSAKIADNVFLLEEGCVIESGSHIKLMEQDGCYADMYKKQAENYVIN